MFDADKKEAIVGEPEPCPEGVKGPSSQQGLGLGLGLGHGANSPIDDPRTRKRAQQERAD